MSDLVDDDLRNQNIDLDSDTNTGNKVPPPASISSKPKDEIKEKPVTIESGVSLSKDKSSTEFYSKSWIDKYLCCLNFLKKYFNITSSDFYSRFLYSLIPFKTKFSEITKDRPDFYGPFWIYTTLILCISTVGSIIKYINGITNSESTNFFQKFIPISAAIIYGAGFGLPAIIGLIMKVVGQGISIASVLCTYGYSYSAFLPSVILCAIPVNVVQILLLVYATLNSTILLAVNYWKDLGNLPGSRKIFLMILVVLVQIGIFCVFYFYFLKNFTSNVKSGGSSTKTNTNTKTN